MSWGLGCGRTWVVLEGVGVFAFFCQDVLRAGERLDNRKLLLGIPGRVGLAPSRSQDSFHGKKLGPRKDSTAVMSS